ncbi:MAG: hypothetical protein WCL51_00470 [Bacteroidota bacterium]
MMKTEEFILEVGNIYTAEELGKIKCKFTKQTNAVIMCRKDETLYIFDLRLYKLNGTYKLLSIVTE